MKKCLSGLIRKNDDIGGKRDFHGLPKRQLPIRGKEYGLPEKDWVQIPSRDTPIIKMGAPIIILPHVPGRGKIQIRNNHGFA